jgi:hypothetical protein
MGNEILCENEVKLLGLTIDCQLKFNTHISEICKKKCFKGITLSTKMPNHRTIIEIRHNIRAINS